MVDFCTVLGPIKQIYLSIGLWLCPEGKKGVRDGLTLTVQFCIWVRMGGRKYSFNMDVQACGILQVMGFICLGSASRRVFFIFYLFYFINFILLILFYFNFLSNHN